jgi:uncharacterized protein (DUF2237 family)
MGLPIRRLILATNENSVLDEFFRTGRYRVRRKVHETSSPSMDISKASNFERYVFDLVGREGARVKDLWRRPGRRGRVRPSHSPWYPAVRASGFVSGASSHEERLRTIRLVHERFGVVIDPHTADGVKVGLEYRDPLVPLICLETALPAKFAATIRAALGRAPSAPPSSPTSRSARSASRSWRTTPRRSSAASRPRCERRMKTEKNVLGGELRACSYAPLTGYFRDGCCATHDQDGVAHLVCVQVTDAFLEFSVAKGNDLVTPRPDLRFRGLKHGDRWCLHVLRWVEAWEAGAPRAWSSRRRTRTCSSTCRSRRSSATRSTSTDLAHAFEPRAVEDGDLAPRHGDEAPLGEVAQQARQGLLLHAEHRRHHVLLTGRLTRRAPAPSAPASVQR